jgi:hypothetical protein
MDGVAAWPGVVLSAAYATNAIAIKKSHFPAARFTQGILFTIV